MFSLTSMSRTNNIRIALANAQKGQESVATYFAQMRSLADELAAAGKPLDDDQLISHILAGLDMEYQPLVSALDARTTPDTLDELFARMSNFDQRMALYQGNDGAFKSSTNVAARGRGDGSGGNPRYRGSPRRGKNKNPSQQRQQRAILLQQLQGSPPELLHQVSPRRHKVSNLRQVGALGKRLLVRFEDDGDSSQDEKVADGADGSYAVDTNWYVDSGATNHMTGELEKVTMREKYRGGDQIHAANEEGSGHEENPVSR